VQISKFHVCFCFEVKKQVVDFLTANQDNGTQISSFVFQFKTFYTIMNLRKKMEQIFPAAFHHDHRLLAHYNAPPPTPMAAAWILFRGPVVGPTYPQCSCFFTIEQ
jgi:hypothetical protein